MKDKILKYGLEWGRHVPDIAMERDCILHGGQWKLRSGKVAGLGMFYHFKAFMTCLWPWITWHRWADLQLECYLKYRLIGQLGPASSGKTFMASAFCLADYYLYPWCTTVLVSSTTRESLEMRILGEIKKLHRSAKEIHDFIPGNLIEGKQRIVTDDRSIAQEGRDFRNGIVGVAVKRGQDFQGMVEFVGIKNKRLRMVGDELQFLPPSFMDSVANLNKNPDFKGIYGGNPKDTTDALGKLCEPAAHLGGWDAGIDQVPKTKTWEIRFPDGVCIQLVGTDSPNLDGKLGIPLITQKDIDADIAFYGKESLQFSMMDQGMMPRGQGLRRVITRQMCVKFHAIEEPVWRDSIRTHIIGLDAAYKGIGGDRCVMVHLEFGLNAQDFPIMSIVSVTLVPVAVTEGSDLAEDQIARFVMLKCQETGIAPENVFFDSTGRGTLMSAFARLWSPNVVPVEFGAQPSDRPVAEGVEISCKDYYSKFVSELWFQVRLIIESGQMRNMTEDLIAEGCYREFGYTEKHKVEVETKEEMKEKSGRSPDLFDALATACHGAINRGFVIRRTVLERRPVNDAWRKLLRERSGKFWKSGQLEYSNR